MAGLRKDRSAWSGSIKDVTPAGIDACKPVSERIEGLNIAIRREKRMLRDPDDAKKQGGCKMKGNIFDLMNRKPGKKRPMKQGPNAGRTW
ncbi:MAG: hypothetical protein V1875_07720 [Candidatus Altiarchaeota archaeon]